jgi:hypothetical protein
VLQTEGSGECAQLGVVPGSGITDNLNNPMILGVTNSSVTIAGYFVVSLGNWSSDLVRVKVTAGLGMDKSDCVTITGEAKFLIRLVLGLATVGIEEPIVIRILVVIASDLLLP